MARKTDDSIIVAMLKEGKLQKEIARHFNVSPAAICKRIKRLQPIEEPESFQNLSQKEKKFALEVADGKSQTDAAMASHDVTTRDSAKAMGYQLMQKPDIQMAIADLMQQEGLSRRYRVQKLKVAIDHADPNVSLKGLDQSWKLEGLYAPEHVIHHIPYSDLEASYKELERQRQVEIAKLGYDPADVIDGEVIPEDRQEVEKGDSEKEGNQE